MKVSVYKRINNNILLEYIYDNFNLLSESYSILINSDENNRRSFISASNSLISKNQELGLDQRSTILSNKNVESNQLVKTNGIDLQYARLDTRQFTSVAKKDFASSIPIRYDSLRVHVPVNYVFDGHIGFHIRIYTLDFDNSNEVDMSNYFFNMTDINQINNIEYNATPLNYAETNWGKYVELQFPSPNKVSDQRKNGSPTINSINHNLTNGVGLSKNAPIMLDFHFINSLNVYDDATFFILEPEVSTSFPHSPDFEKFGVVVEPSTQGDFFLIYPIFNGSIGEFNQWIEESIVDGNRYYLKYVIDIYEKNIKTSSQTIIITEDFIEEIEFRPIFKYSTTTAIIDVSCSLIDSVDETIVERKASYGMLHDEVSKYSRFLTKINLKKANKEQVHKIKTLNVPNTSGYMNVNTELSIIKSSFIVYSRTYYITQEKGSIKQNGVTWMANRKSKVDIFPFDNAIVFKTIAPDTINKYKPFNYTDYSDIKMNIMSDEKKLAFDIYNDSDVNNKENGVIVFKLKEGQYKSIRKIHQSGFDLFYITGIKDDIEIIIYTGFINPWSSEKNKNYLNQLFQNEGFIPTIELPILTKDIETINNVVESIDSESGVPKSVNKTGENNAKNQNSPIKKNISIEDQRNMINLKLLKWTPTSEYPKSLQEQLGIYMNSYKYKFENNTTNGINKWEYPGDIRKFAILMRDNGFIPRIEIEYTTGNFSQLTQLNIDVMLGYFKSYNFNPMDESIINYLKDKESVLNWKTGINRQISYTVVTSGSNTPPSQDIYDTIKEAYLFESKNKINS